MLRNAEVLINDKNITVEQRDVELKNRLKIVCFSEP